MALKDVTLGQYFPGNSLIHRLDPRSKLIFTVLYIVVIFLCKHLVSYGLVLATLLVLIGISGVQPKVFLKGMKPVVFIVVFTAILNLFYTDGTVLWSLGFLKITEEGIWKAFFMVLRILMLIASTHAFNTSAVCAPTFRSAASPSLNRISVGLDMMPYCCASS